MRLWQQGPWKCVVKYWNSWLERLTPPTPTPMHLLYPKMSEGHGEVFVGQASFLGFTLHSTVSLLWAVWIMEQTETSRVHCACRTH